MRTPRRKRAKRAARILRLVKQIARFVKERGYWPSAEEMAAYVGRGSRWSSWRDLVTLRQAGLVALEHRAWTITLDGFALLGIPPIAPPLVRRPKAKTHKQKVAETRARREATRRATFEIFERPGVAAPWVSEQPPTHHYGLEIVN